MITIVFPRNQNMSIDKRNQAIANINDSLTSGNAVFLDTETIGGFDNPVMIELAITDIEKNKLFDNYVFPWYIPDSFKLQNGCDWVEVQQAYDFESHYQNIKDILKDKDIYIYNKSFDIRVFEKVCEFYQLPLPLDVKRVHCLMSYYKAITGDLKPLKGDHTAFGDVCVMSDLFKELATYEPIELMVNDDNIADTIKQYQEICNQIKDLEAYKKLYSDRIKQHILKDVGLGDKTTVEIKTPAETIKVSGRVDIVAKIDNPLEVPEKYFKTTFDRFLAAKDFIDSGEITPGITYERSEVLGKIVIS
ncbi:exonuclease RNase T and DNA polymerase [Nostoc phage N1]|nr:exonuclease RNase T and DNA polymerase [Nostoc phage N1]